jgi:peptidoglycan hydrolase FlgJ
MMPNAAPSLDLPVTAPHATTDPVAARRAAREFEALFVSQMIAEMFTDIGADPIFGGGHAEEMWRSMLHQEYGREIVQRGGFGLADAVMREVLQAQEGPVT